ncbi:MAG: RNA polymerase subunit sigma-70, partial [Mesorhizobium sp.]
ILRGPDGDFVPLAAQDIALWDDSLIDDAEALLARAAQRGIIGRYQLEAAVQSAHTARRRGSGTDWAAIRQLY